MIFFPLLIERHTHKKEGESDDWNKCASISIDLEKKMS